jgi:hypothetical protein
MYITDNASWEAHNPNLTLPACAVSVDCQVRGSSFPRTRVMLHLVPNDRTYSPETVALMTAAFARVCQSVSHQVNEKSGNEEMRRTLALIILRYVDRGERDPERLADVAFREWTGSTARRPDDRPLGGTDTGPLVSSP